MQGAFDRGEQGIVLLNRRGFSPSLLCRACGHDFRCGSCSVARTYHRRGERLLCHYCGDFVPRPRACPACGSEVLMPVGFGTERLAERFEEVFPGIPYAVLDRDAAARRGGAARVLADFESGIGPGPPRDANGGEGTRLPERDGSGGPRRGRASLVSRLPLGRTYVPARHPGGRSRRSRGQARNRRGPDGAPGARGDRSGRGAGPRPFRGGGASLPPDLRLPAFLPPPARALDGQGAPRGGSGRPDGTGGHRFAAPSASPRARSGPLERLKGLYRVQLLIKSDSREALAEAGERLRELDAPPRLDRDPQSLL
ncbi:MAG: hypothetical protein IPF66_05560 [Holophagales bacterium]|nr:hypothetical protein [Holophagales bacterium]